MTNHRLAMFLPAVIRPRCDTAQVFYPQMRRHASTLIRTGDADISAKQVQKGPNQERTRHHQTLYGTRTAQLPQ